MRKCDVCGTKIPLNSTSCPICGQQYNNNKTIVGLTTPRKTIDWKLVLRILGRVLLFALVINRGYALLKSEPQPTPDDFYKNQYGENYVLKKYQDFDLFQNDYPQLADQLEPIYQLAQHRKSYEKHPENVFPSGIQTNITIINDVIDSASFDMAIHDSYKDVGIFYSLIRPMNSTWNENISVDYYNIKKDELLPLVESLLSYVEEILEINMKDVISNISGEMNNYYRATIYDTVIGDYQFEFNYNGNGDLFIHMYHTLNN